MNHDSTSQTFQRWGRTIGGRFYLPSGFAVLRTPLLPLEEFQAWSAGFLASDGPGGAKGNPDSDRSALCSSLAEIYRRPEIQEALFLASPDLAGELDGFLASPAKPGSERVFQALVRYFLRLSCRPTPFGLFSGCSLVKLGSLTELGLPALADYSRTTRLDMDFLAEVFARVSVEPSIQDQIAFGINDSLYDFGDRLRYVESRIQESGNSHHLVDVENSEFLEMVRGVSHQGARPGEIARMLCEMDSEIPMNEAVDFVKELISAKILVSRVTPPCTGTDALAPLLEQMETVPAAQAIHAALVEVQHLLSEIDSAGVGASQQKYFSLEHKLSSLFDDTKQKHLVQVDMWKSAPNATLSARVASEILGAVKALGSIAPEPEDSILDEFKQRFASRYQDRFVPLAEALDAEAGIGFESDRSPNSGGAPFLDDIPFQGVSTFKSAPWRPFHSFLLNRLTEAARKGETEFEILESDFEDYRTDSPPRLPDAFAAMISLLGPPQRRAKSGDLPLIHLKVLSGPSGASLLGRFCHLDDGLANEVRNHLRAEEANNPGAIYAEIAHVPEGRVGNVVFRPVLRSHEIPYLGFSGADPDSIIPLTDLWVGVSNDRIVIRSKKLQREILPRLTSAHNYSYRSVATYKFLCVLQRQDSAGLPSFDWGPLNSAKFLPRVRYGNILLSLARWQLSQSQIRKVCEGNSAARFTQAQSMRRELDLPQLVEVVEGDNAMPVDFDNVVSIDVMCELIKNQPIAVFREFLPQSVDSPVVGPEGHFRNEIIIPFVRSPRSSEHADPQTEPNPLAERSLSPSAINKYPGSDWLYAKLYCGDVMANHLLTGVVAPLAKKLLSDGLIDTWFFIRYSDPDNHLRLRFHGDPYELTSRVLPELQAVCAPHLESGLVWDIQYGAYRREAFRYGGHEGVQLAERLFQADSEAVVQLIAGLDGSVLSEHGWLLALGGIDQLLYDLGLSLKEKAENVGSLRSAFALEFGPAPPIKKTLGLKYRAERTRISHFLDFLNGGAVSDTIVNDLAIFQKASSAFRQRSEHSTHAIQGLRYLEEKGKLTLSVAKMASSIAHMHANRLIRSNARTHELVIYDFLARHYDSSLALQRKTEGNGET